MPRRALMIFILATGVFGILNTEMGFIGILPAIAREFDVSIVQAGSLISLFALGVALAGPTMPLLLSGINRKLLMVGILGLFTLCNLIAMYTDNFTVLLLVRVLPAFFHPVYCAMAFSVASALAAPGKAPLAVAKINIGVAAGMVAGVPVSNYLAEQFSLTASLGFFASVTALVLILTVVLVPSMPVRARLSYGSQLLVLKKSALWLAAATVICANGSIYGVFNYAAEYLSTFADLAPAWVSTLLLVYGLCNIAGSMLAGHLLTATPAWLSRLFPVGVALIYLTLLGGGQAWPVIAVLIVMWGILGGLNANLNQYWIAHAAPEAPDFANGIFLTCANLGCVAGMVVCGACIDRLGLEYVVVGGLICSAAATVLILKMYAGSGRQDNRTGNAVKENAAAQSAGAGAALKEDLALAAVPATASSSR